jgi:hypothetical protein
MQKTDLDFFLNQNVQIELSNFILSLFCAAILSFIVHLFYVRFSSTLSNRIEFSKNFVVLGVATCIVIMIVKSSLALSLGLVGALSIVRFRAAIKEPEELVYLFLAISNGIGFASGQIVITFSIFVLIFLIIWFVITKKNNLKGLDYNLVVQWTADKNDKNRKQIETIINKLKSTFLDINIVRLEKLEEGNSMVVVRVNMQDISQIDIFNNSLEEEFKNIKVSFYESKFLY